MSSRKNLSMKALLTLLLLLIKVYQVVTAWIPKHCRFYPSCSCYAQEALSRFGLVQGLCLSVGRILRCHPFHPGGVDSVPDCATMTPTASRIRL